MQGRGGAGGGAAVMISTHNFYVDFNQESRMCKKIVWRFGYTNFFLAGFRITNWELAPVEDIYLIYLWRICK